MIKINLAPDDLIENKRWFLPDVVILAVVFASCWFSTNHFIKKIRQETTEIAIETVAINLKNKELKTDIKFYDLLDKDKVKIASRIVSMKALVDSRINRYSPLLTLQIIHKAMPLGIWINFLEFKSRYSSISFTAGSFDSLIIAEFIASLKDHSNKTNSSSVLDAVSFDQVVLDRLTYTGDHNYQGEGEEDMNQDSSSDNNDKDRSGVFMNTISHWQDGKKFYPETAAYPVFNVSIRYTLKDEVL
jgi:hypothetical protein